MTPELGKLITTDEERDAVHIAIIPVIAVEMLPPGQHVGLWNNNYLSIEIPLVGVCHNPIGIVDPFLKRDVQKGQKFWLFLYPNTVTSLKHHWTHPAFKDQVPIPDLPEDVEESKRWLEEFAASGYVTYERLMEMAEERHFTFRTEMYDYHDDASKLKFWRHYERVTGNSVPDFIIENTYFGCSC